jgi:uncharacterized protein YpmB
MSERMPWSQIIFISIIIILVIGVGFLVLYEAELDSDNYRYCEAHNFTITNNINCSEYVGWSGNQLSCDLNQIYTKQFIVTILVILLVAILGVASLIFSLVIIKEEEEK